MDIVSIRAAQLEYGDSLRSIAGYKVARGDAALVLANVPQFMIDAAQYGENLCGKPNLNEPIIVAEQKDDVYERIAALEAGTSDLATAAYDRHVLKRKAFTHELDYVLAVEFAVSADQQTAVATQILVKWKLSNVITWEPYQVSMLKNARVPGPFYDSMAALMESVINWGTQSIANWGAVEVLVANVRRENVKLAQIDAVLNNSKAYQAYVRRLTPERIVPVMSDVIETCQEVYEHQSTAWRIQFDESDEDAVVIAFPPQPASEGEKAAVKTETGERATSETAWDQDGTVTEVKINWVLVEGRYEPASFAAGISMVKKELVTVQTFDADFLETLKLDAHSEPVIFVRYVRRRMARDYSKPPAPSKTVKGMRPIPSWKKAHAKAQAAVPAVPAVPAV